MTRLLLIIIYCFMSFAATASYGAGSFMASFSERDKIHIEQALKLADKDKFDHAHEKISSLSDPVISTLIDWMQFRQAFSKNDYKAIYQFIQQHSGWPEEYRLRRQMEYSIPFDEPSKKSCRFL